MSLLLRFLPVQRSATLNGAGVLSATATHIVSATATFAGLGALASSANRIRYAVSTEIGLGALTATGQVLHVRTATVSGLGSLLVTGTLIPFAAPAIFGRGPRKIRLYRLVETPPVAFAPPDLSRPRRVDLEPKVWKVGRPVPQPMPADVPTPKARPVGPPARSFVVRPAPMLPPPLVVRTRVTPPAPQLPLLRPATAQLAVATFRGRGRLDARAEIEAQAVAVEELLAELSLEELAMVATVVFDE